MLTKLKQTKNNIFLKNLLYLGSSEVLNRIFRLGSTVVLARMLSQYDFGLIAIIRIVTEFSRILTLGTGVGTKLIQAKEEDVDTLANTCYWLNWIICISLFLLQCLSAPLIAHWYKNPDLLLPVCVMGLLFIGIPIGQTNFDLLTRENKLKEVSKLGIINSIVNNGLMALLALLGLGLWSVVIPQVITSFIWGFYSRHRHPWRPKGKFTLYRSRELLAVAGDVMGVEFFNKVRNNIDYILISTFLGVEALGLYYFAFNAGLGISLSITGAYTTALFPYLCAHKLELNKLKSKFLSTLKMMSFIIIPFVLLQSSLAHIYVPIVFGTKWIPAIPVLVLICLSAIPRPFAEGAGMLLNATDRTRINLLWGLLFTMIFGLAITLSVQGGLIWVAASVALVHWICLPLFTLWSYRLVFRRSA